MDSGSGGQRRLLLYGLLALMLLFWSANFVVAKFALREFSASLAGSLRVVLAALFIMPAFVWQSRTQPPEPWSKRDLVELFGLGVCGVALNQLLFILGLSRTTVTHAAFISCMMPILVLLMAAAVGQERMTTRKMLGMGMAFAGVGLLHLFPVAPPPKSAAPSLFGDFLILCGGIAFAVFTVFGKHVSSRHSSITMSAFGFGGGAVAVLPLILWLSRDFDYAAVTWVGWSTLAYMALFPSVVSYLIYYWALKRIDASRVSSLLYLQPALATGLAAVTLGERVTLPVVASGAVIFGGVYLAGRR